MTDHPERASSSEGETRPSPTRPGADQARGGFLGFVAHEIRNPLATALWCAELLARLAPEDRAGARGEKLIGMSLRALQRLRLLVEDHFLAERLDVSGLPVRAEVIPLKDALATAVQRAAGGAEVTLDVQDGLAVTADRTLLERALDGMVAVSARGKVPVRVEARRSGGRAVIRLAGAPPAADALQPPQKGTMSDPSGRALALHMALRVAAALGGSLAIDGGSYVLELLAADAAVE